MTHNVLPRTDPLALPTPSAVRRAGTLVNDVHARLNPTLVGDIVVPRSADSLPSIVRHARSRQLPICIAGGKHAMGGQQFRHGGLLIDTRAMTRVLRFDRLRGLVEAEAGIQWPALIDHLIAAQSDGETGWGIAQKQTGADALTLGGAVAANVHGRGLTMSPFIGDIEELTVVGPDGDVRRCSRTENGVLFRLVVGGYGLFGIVATVVLRLTPRRKMARVVELLDADELMPAFEARIAEGHLYGDFQFAIDETSDDFLRAGVLSTYRPVPPETPIPAQQRSLTDADWSELLYLAHADKGEAFRRYAAHYLATSSQLYWSDTHQLTTYLDDYHRALDLRLGTSHRASEMIGELYVPRGALIGFLDAARAELRSARANVIYGTIRLIERDAETFLPWARERYACIVLNLHIDHEPAALARAAATFRRLIDCAADRGGSFYLTYHRWARRDQLTRCYPEIDEWMYRKRELDPAEAFSSDWWEWLLACAADG